METHVFNPEQFERTIILLKQYGVVQRQADREAAQTHNDAYFQYGDFAASLVPDESPTLNEKDVGKAIVGLLETIPGVDTKGIAETVSKKESIGISDQALTAALRTNGGSEVGMYLTFPTAFPIPENEYFDLRFSRTDGHSELNIKIRMDSGCFPRNGVIEMKSIGSYQPHVKGFRYSAKFGQDSVITEGSEDLGLTKGEEINIVKLISEITTPHDLGSELHPAATIEKAKFGQLRSTTV